MSSRRYLWLAAIGVAAVAALWSGKRHVSPRPAAAPPTAPSGPDTAPATPAVHDKTTASPPVFATQPVTAAEIAAGEILLRTRPDNRWRQSAKEPVFAEFAVWVDEFAAGEATEAEGIRLATRRRAELEALIRENPERAIELSVPASMRLRLPASVQALLEQPIDGRGDLAVMAAMPEPGQAPGRPANSRYATLSSRTLDAYVYGRRLGQPTRWGIPLHGVALGNSVALDESPVRVLDPAEAAAVKATLPVDPICSVSGLVSTANNAEIALDVGGATTFLCSPGHAARLAAALAEAENQLPAGASDPTKGASSDFRQTGTRTFLLIRVDFSDYPGGSISAADGTNVITSLGISFSNWSCGRMMVAEAGAGSDVTPLLRMPQSNAGYNGNDGQLQSDARAAALATGYNYAAYDFDAVCFAGNTPDWGYGGLAYVGARGVWLHTTGQSSTAGIGTHEFGHNFGLNHANFYDAPAGSVIGPGGSNVEYGNPWDTMGSASTNNTFGARQKQYLGWITNGAAGNEWISLTSGTSTNRLYAHDVTQAPGLLKGVRMTRDTSLGDEAYYWVEYRTAKTNQWLDNGVTLHWAGSGNERPELLDSTPDTLHGKDDSAIAIGRTFSDTNYGIHITPVAKGSGSPGWVDVVVRFGQFTNNSAPTLSLSPSATSTSTGTPLTFTASASDPEGDDLAYFWSFGDDTISANTPVINHAWSANGEYVVQCTVTDMKGKIAMESVVIRVGNPSTFRISGTVLLNSQPVPNARVSTSSTRYTYTDSDGSYDLVGFNTGTNTVSVSLEGHVFIPAYGGTNVVVLGPTTNGVDFIGGVPVMGGLVSRTMNWNSTNAPMLFWTFDYESPGSNLVMDAFSGNTNLMPDGSFVFSTTGTNRLLTLKPATNASGTVTNFISVTDPGGFSRTNTFTLTVNPPPAVLTTNRTTNEDIGLDIDLFPLTSDSTPVNTADSNMLFTVSSASNGAVSLVSNRYARFVPASNYSGPASFSFTATDKGYDPNLLLYYDFDSGQSNDRSGNARTATLDKDGSGNFLLISNAASPALAPFSLVALQLDDNGNSNSARLYRRITTGEYNFNNADWSFACWFRRDTSTNDDLLFHIGVGDAAGNDGQELFAYLASGNNSVRLRHYDGSSVLDLNLSTAATVLTGEWHHVAVTFDRTNTSKGDFKLYLDGMLADSTNGVTLGMAQTNIVFGGHDNTNNTHRWFSGALDEVALWKAVLAPSKVAYLQDHIVAHLGGLSRSTNISLTIMPVNDPPTITQLGDYQILEDTFTGDIPFTIGDVETAASNLVLGVSSSNPNLVPNVPANLVLGGANASRTLRVYPATNASGTTTITVLLSDGITTTNRQFTLTVMPVNDPPALLSLPTQYAYSGVMLSFALPATDPDVPANPLSFGLVSPPAGASVDAATGMFTWSPDGGQLGPHLINAVVTDNGTPNLSGTNIYSVVVLETLSSNALSLVNDDWVLTWNSIPGRTYRVQFKNDLADVSWSDLPGDVTATETVSSKSDSIGAAPRRFYQILLLP